MGKTYYQGEESPVPTMTVGQLIEALSKFDPEDKAVFKSPMYGCFGSNTAYSIEQVERVVIPRKEHFFQGGMGEDEETGQQYLVEDEIQVWHEWQGVVIS